MRILGIDFGERRIGLALSDPTGTIASPLPTMARRAGKRPPIKALAEIAAENDVEVIVMGLPLNLAGDETEWCAEIRRVGALLEDRTGLSVRYVDERMTSVQAERAVRSLGLPKKERERKERIDAAAAVLILQRWLDVSGDPGQEDPTP
ncbi:MAG: Holliday junction resolvase RuvX [Gemmatimonadetes bacterium]|nr:Holliday junction resolvase RuvX [Gemmatimonadota bacterium]